MKMAYYPGCSLHSMAIEYDLSTRKVCEVMGVELKEIKDWICCGSSPAHQSDELMSIALPAKNLALTAETDNLKEVCVPCVSCYSRLKVTQQRMTDEAMRKDVEKVIGSECPDDIKVLHALDVVLEKIGIEAVKEKVVKSLNGLKVACYYGCLMTRPPKVTEKKDFENPMALDSLVEALGAEPLDWNLKTYCCGAGFALTQLDLVLELTRKIIADADAVGAEAIVVGCPICHFNIDSRQQEINKKFGTNFNIPVYYFTELMGVAFGVEPKELGIPRHFTEAEEFLRERALI